MSGEQGIAVGMMLRDERSRPIRTLLHYDPATNPLVIGAHLCSSFLHTDITIARTLLVQAFTVAPRACGEGEIELQVRDPHTMRVSLRDRHPAPGSVLFASTQAVMAFGQSTLTMVPVCMRSPCDDPLCRECMWLRSVIPWCSCGTLGCPGHRS